MSDRPHALAAPDLPHALDRMDSGCGATVESGKTNMIGEERFPIAHQDCFSEYRSFSTVDRKLGREMLIDTASLILACRHAHRGLSGEEEELIFFVHVHPVSFGESWDQP